MQDDQNSASQGIDKFVNILYLLVGFLAVYAFRTKETGLHVGFFGALFEYILGGVAGVIGGNIGPLFEDSLKYRAIGCIVGAGIGAAIASAIFR